MPYHLVFTVFFIHLFSLFNIYIKDEIPPPENYVACDLINLSAETIKCHQQSVAQSKQFLYYISQRNNLDGLIDQKTVAATKISTRTEEFSLEHIKLQLRLQKIDAKIEQITDTTPPRIILALQRQRKHIMIKFDDYFKRFFAYAKESDAFYATLSSD